MKNKVVFIASLFITASAAAKEPPAEASVRPSVVTLQKVEPGYAYADPKGMTLYVFDVDTGTPGTSACTLVNHCQTRWPPLYAQATDTAVGDWTIITRPDKTLQWAHKGRPVYTYYDDLTPGVMSGDGDRGRWHAIVLAEPTPTPLMPGGFRIKRSMDGWRYTDHQNRDIYAPVNAKNGRAKCDPACLQTWKPLRAGTLARSLGQWTVIERDDGFRQWAYNGTALYVAADGVASGPVNTTEWQSVAVKE